MSVCGKLVTRTQASHTATLESESETIGSVTTETKLHLSAGSGRMDVREFITPNYTKTQTYTYSPKGDVVLGRKDVYSQTIGPGFVGPPQTYSTEEWGWTVRGY